MAKIIYGVSDIDTMMAGKQNELTAGTGIDITNNVISATGTGGMSAHTYANFNALVTDAVANTNSLLVVDWNGRKTICTVYQYTEEGTTYTQITPNNTIVPVEDALGKHIYIKSSISMNITSATTTSVTVNNDVVDINITTGAVSTSTSSDTFNIGSFILYY